MKPLVNYCRWNQARLRLHGRDQGHVWGHLVFIDPDGNERVTPFDFVLETAALTLQSEGGEQTILLDEMGVKRPNPE